MNEQILNAPEYLFLFFSENRQFCLSIASFPGLIIEIAVRAMQISQM